MPPRIPRRVCSHFTQSSSAPVATGCLSLSGCPPPVLSNSSPSSRPQPCCQPRASASFSTSAPCRKTARDWKDLSIARRKFYYWLQNNGEQYRRHPTKLGSPKYASRLFGEADTAPKEPAGEPGADKANAQPKKNDNSKGRWEQGAKNDVAERAHQPFAYNKDFISQPVLSDAARRKIWLRYKRGEPLKLIAADCNVDIRRVAAVIRLMAIQHSWIVQGKPLAAPYAQAMMKVLPLTNLAEDGSEPPHETVNDVGVLSATMTQLFVPTSESRHFSRRDAGAAFGVLPPDRRIPMTELVDLERDRAAGVPDEEAQINFKKRARASQRAYAERLERDRAAAEAERIRIDTPRFEFRIRNFSIEDAGHDGRGPKGVGWRYGVPWPDRKRAQVKIPTRVE